MVDDFTFIFNPIYPPTYSEAVMCERLTLHTPALHNDLYRTTIEAFFQFQ